MKHNKIHSTLRQIKPYDRFIEWTKVATIPGFGSLPLYTVFTFFFQEIARESILNKASSLAYNFMLAIFPGILFLFTLIPYIPVSNFQQKLLDLITVALPLNAYEVLQATLVDIIKNQNSGLLSVGFLLATMFATNGMATLMMAFNKAALYKEKRSWIRRRIVAIFLAFAIVFALTIGIGIFTGAGFVITYLKSHINYDLSWFWTLTLKLSRWVVLFGIYFITVSLLFKFGPSDAKKWKFLNAGATLATILAVITFSIFTFYINNFGAYNKLYGSIGTLIVVMIWMYLNSLILLIGFELNAAIALSKQSIKIVKPRFYNSFKPPKALD
ncbi:MAG: YihY/virulence factor BrkB family protein [Sphingobacterium sp.]|uniref:YihY/virulence factor BrkB family protein n=1 Tax=Sphingobacterium sp. JB170 TaxID=1434842 RepID=UPI00097F0909|nr:YihY/virulence factor BrkB family protein [Sphingobacterium sp. JB170]SJN30688.1 Ribonuclease BN [Sphingobacterium sp. JB170]